MKRVWYSWWRRGILVKLFTENYINASSKYVIATSGSEEVGSHVKSVKSRSST